MRLTVTREVSQSIGRCQLTHLVREKIDAQAARLQHQQYEHCLAGLNCEIRRLPAEPELPDAVFIEDTAIVLPELAIMTLPGAASRRLETKKVAGVLKSYRELARIEEPGTVDGGDVLVVDQQVYVGLSSRTNTNGCEQIGSLLTPLGYSVVPVPVNHCLHLKSAVTQVAPESLLINRHWVNEASFAGIRLIDVHPLEPWAANALLVEDTVVFPAAFPHTQERLTRLGILVAPVDVAELAKAEGGVTCCSLIFDI